MSPASIAICIFLTAFHLFGLQDSAPLHGTWRLNLEKSSENPDRPYKRVTLKIEPSGEGLRVVYDMVGTRGGTTHIEWLGKLDGSDYAVQGVDYVLTNAYRRVDDRTYEIVVKVDGRVAAAAQVTVSADGKSLTSITTERRAQGRDITTIAVYDRV